MSSVEISAKSLEEAKQQAAEQLGVSVEQLEVEIIEEPRRLLGILGGGDYHIKATVIEASQASEAPAEEIAPEPADSCDAAPEPAPAAPQPAPSAPAEAGMEAVAERAQKILQDIVDLMELPGEAVISGIEGRDILLQVNGQDLGALIGRHGATLDALQLLVSVAANNIENTGARVVVDAEQYRERRKQMLEKMAFAEADKVRKSQKELVIPDLKPYERRIVHMALKDDPDVETYSEGEGEQRQLVITPKS